MKIAIFPGSFDPFTVGHESIVRRALTIVDKVVVGIGVNTLKKGFMSTDMRLKMIQDVFADDPRVEVNLYNGLTIHFAESVEADFILRGVRNAVDLDYETPIAHINRRISGLESLFILTQEEHSSISSSIVRDLLIHKADVSAFVPSNISIKDYL